MTRLANLAAMFIIVKSSQETDSRFSYSFFGSMKSLVSSDQVAGFESGVWELGKDAEVTEPSPALARENKGLVPGPMWFKATPGPFLFLCHLHWKGYTNFSCQRNWRILPERGTKTGSHEGYIRRPLGLHPVSPPSPLPDSLGHTLDRWAAFHVGRRLDPLHFISPLFLFAPLFFSWRRWFLV